MKAVRRGRTVSFLDLQGKLSDIDTNLCLVVVVFFVCVCNLKLEFVRCFDNEKAGNRFQCNTIYWVLRNVL